MVVKSEPKTKETPWLHSFLQPRSQCSQSHTLPELQAMPMASRNDELVLAILRHPPIICQDTRQTEKTGHFDTKN